MNQAFTLNYRLSHGNMHIDLQGYFDKSSAKKVLEFLSDTYQGSGRVFMDTANLSALSECGIRYIKDFFPKISLPTHNLYLKGEQGRCLLPEGARLIIFNQKTEKNGDEKSQNFLKKTSCACGGSCGGAEKGHGKCKVCKCALAKKGL